MTERHLSIEDFEGYELLDSGDHMKLERFGAYTFSRPDTQAIWKKQKPELWNKVDGVFASETGKGSWKMDTEVPPSWEVSYKDTAFIAKLGNFKHTGIFPEQEPNWSWSMKQIESLKSPEVLNLFGYTGAASIIAARAGAKVTHVDSSKASVNWCKENAARAGLSDDSIRYIFEDARGFAKREVRRGAKYNGIILDPPAFGRGAKDEVWKIEEDMIPLMETLKELMSSEPGSFFLINGYAAGYAPQSFAQLVQSVFPSADIEYGELRLPEKETGRSISEGIYARFVA